MSMAGRLVFPLVAGIFAGSTALAQLDWNVRIDSPVIQPTIAPALAYDSARARTVLFDGRETWEWDGIAWTQRSTSTSPSASYYPMLAYDAAHRRVVAFGRNPRNRASETWEWDGDVWRQALPATSPPTRIWSAMAYDAARGRIVLFGGRNERSPDSFDDTWEWDGTNWEQRFPETHPSPRYGHRMAYDAIRSRIVLVGGDWTPDPSVWEWDGTTWTSVPVSDSRPIARLGFGLAYDAILNRLVQFDSSIHAFGSTTWEWEGATWAPATFTGAPSPRYAVSIVFDAARQRLVLVGGADFDTWESDGTGWVQVVPPRAPLGYVRSRTAAFDASRGRAVLFVAPTTWEWDGRQFLAFESAPTVDRDNTFSLSYDSTRERVMLLRTDAHPRSTELWEWTGSNWQQDFPTTPLPFGFVWRIAFDSRRHVLVAVGGSGEHYPDRTLDTWEWDGVTWTDRSAAVRPPFPSFNPPDFAMAYDEARSRVVIFTGYPVGETWEWDGTDWTLVTSVTSPPARIDAAMTYNPSRRSIVLFGGNTRESMLADTWEWNGRDWIERITEHHPPACSIGGLIFDTTRQRLALLGGQQLGSPLTEVWELGPSPTILPPIGSRLGSDRVVLDGFNVNSNEGVQVRFGNRLAAVESAAGDRVVVRTPPGDGTVDVAISTPESSIRLDQAFRYVEPVLLARYGTVNLARGLPEEVLLVNATSGDPDTRELTLSVNAPIDAVIQRPSSRVTARFALYAWGRQPLDSTLTPLPRSVGTMVFAPPFLGGSPPIVWNNIGRRRVLGVPTMPSRPAPSIVFRSAGVRSPATVTLQGLIEDDGSVSRAGLSATNAVILRIR